MKSKCSVWLKRSVGMLAACLILSASFAAAQDVTIKIKSGDKAEVEVEQDGKAPFTGKRPAVDVAILLDTSNSMDGLIQQAKSQLWTIVQEFAQAEKDGKTPTLRVSVFEYGNSRLPASEGYIRQVVQLTDDLDKVSEALFSLKTSGGDEYCGMVIGEALKRLDWSGKDNAYKAIFIAGNEPFTQGSTDYRESCKSAIEQGIVINTIHCGDYDTGISTKWKDAADLAEGKYLNIDQDRKTIHIETPHDEIIIRLNAELNKTYLWYGKGEVREALAANQLAQDSNAASAGKMSLLSRAQTKGGALYSNRGRDLVDSFAENDDVLEEVADEELPDELKSMTEEQRKAYVEEQLAKRTSLKAMIQAETAARDKLVAAKRKAMAEAAGEATLGDAMSAAVRGQLKAAGFEMQNK